MKHKIRVTFSLDLRPEEILEKVLKDFVHDLETNWEGRELLVEILDEQVTRPYGTK